MRYLRFVAATLILFSILFFSFLILPVFANNSPDRNHSSLSVANQAPADGHSTISVTVTLQDSSGSPLSGDTVSFADSSNSSAIFSPTSATLNSSGQTTFTITSTSASTDNISITDTSSNITLNSLGQVTFTLNMSPTPIGACSYPAPGGTPQFISETPDGPNKIILTWTDAGDPVSSYLIAYGVTPGQYIYGNPNVGGQGTTSYTVGSLSPGKKYYFAVKAVNGCYPGSFSNEVSATAGMVNTPTPTQSVMATSIPVTLTPTPFSTIFNTSNQNTVSIENSPTPTEGLQKQTNMLIPTSTSGPSTIKIIEYIAICSVSLGILAGVIYWGFIKDTKKLSN